MLTSLSSQQQAAAQNVRPPAPKPSVSVEKAGWKANGNSGGGHTAHDGKVQGAHSSLNSCCSLSTFVFSSYTLPCLAGSLQFKKSEGGKKVVYAPGALPAKKSLSDLP
jgi:hypothetical protein